MAFSTDDLEALRRDLAQLPPARPKSVSNRDAVGALTSELAAAQRLGYSVDDLAQLLSSKGLRMTAGTIDSRAKDPMSVVVNEPWGLHAFREANN